MPVFRSIFVSVALLAAASAAVAQEDDLDKRLRARLSKVDPSERDAFLDRLEKAAPGERRALAEKFLRGKETWEDRLERLLPPRRKKCDPAARAARLVLEVWKGIPERDRAELARGFARLFVELYRAAPEDVRRELLREMQKELLRGFLPGRKAPKKDKRRAY